MNSYMVHTTVYSKPTHTYKYLHLDNHHKLSAEYSVFNILTHRARTVCGTPQLLLKENEHIRKILSRCASTLHGISIDLKL